MVDTSYCTHYKPVHSPETLTVDEQLITTSQ